MRERGRIPAFRRRRFCISAGLSSSGAEQEDLQRVHVCELDDVNNSTSILSAIIDSGRACFSWEEKRLSRRVKDRKLANKAMIIV